MMKMFWRIFDNVLYTLGLLSWGAIFMVHNRFNGKNLNFHFPFKSTASVITEMILAIIAMSVLGVAAYFIAKKYKAQKPYKVVLITLAVIAVSQSLVWFLGLNKILNKFF